MTQEKLMLHSVIFENLLKINKTQLYHELIIENNIKIAHDGINSQEKAKLKKLNKEHKKNIERAEKYNNEVTKIFCSINDKFDPVEFVDSLQDFYSDLCDVLFSVTKDLSKEESKKLIPAILENQKDGLFKSGKNKYKVHLKK